MTYHLEESATAVVILVVALEVLGEVRNSVSKNCDLNLGRSGVTLVDGVLFNNCLLFCCCHFRIHLSKIKYFLFHGPHRNREGEIHAFGCLHKEFYRRDIVKIMILTGLEKPCRRFTAYIITQKKQFVKRFSKKILNSFPRPARK